MEKKDLVSIRNYKESDKNFILATFLRGLYYGDTSYYREMDKDVFMKHYHKVIETVLSHPGVLIQVACLKEDTDVILGYSVLSANSSGLTLSWVFVKAAWRGIGIAKSLVPIDKVNFVTHLTKSGLSIMRKHSHISFNPWIEIA